MFYLLPSVVTLLGRAGAIPGWAHRKRTGRVSFFFNDPATTEIYTLSLHDALPISLSEAMKFGTRMMSTFASNMSDAMFPRSEEHTSELQSHVNLVCRLLLEKKNPTPPVRGFHFSVATGCFSNCFPCFPFSSSWPFS